MDQKEKFNNILNECLDRIIQGETVEQCLRSYPDLARELEPLLRTAQAARVASTIQPRADFKARARYEFQTAVRGMVEKKSQLSFFSSWRWHWQSGWAIALVAVIVVVLGGGGTVAASSKSMPDSALYSVKLASEQAQLVVTPSEVSKAELNAKFVDRRTEEIDYMASKGDAQQVQVAAQQLNTNMKNITNLVMSKIGYGGGDNGDAAAPMLESRDAAMQPEQSPQPMMGAASAPAPTTTVPAVTVPPKTTAAPTTAVPRTTVPPTITVPPAAVSSPAASVAPAPAAPTRSVVPTPRVDVVVPQPASSTKSATRSQDTPTTLKAANTRISEREKIKEIMINNFNKNKARLEESLKKASPEVRPAIRQAIAKTTAEYEKALRNIEWAER